MRNFLACLTYLAVLARALGWSPEHPPIQPRVWALLALFGLLLALEPWLTRRLPALPRLYALAQAALVITILYSNPSLDFIAILFIPLSFQVVELFGSRLGFAWVALFSLAMAGLLFRGLEWEPGLVMLFSVTGTNILLGSLAVLMQRTGRVQAENRRLFAGLQEAYRSLKDEAAQAEALAALEERHTLVRELHDSLTQTLFSMNLAVQAARLAAPSDPPQAVPHLRRLQSLSRRAAGEVRALTRPLSPGDRLGGGLLPAMRRLVSERQTQDGLEITLEVRGEAERLPPDVAVQLYAIAQEALNNVAKHSGAAQAVVRLDLAGVRASLEVEDCGRGFEPHVAASRSGYGEAGYGEAGYGLSEMAGRAAEIGWDFQVESTPGHGTLIRLQERAA